MHKSLRLQAIRLSHEHFPSNNNNIEGVYIPLTPPASNVGEGSKDGISVLVSLCRGADLVEAPQRPQTLQKPSTSFRKRKRGQEEEEDVERPLFQTQKQPPLKRPQTSPSSFINKEGSHQVPTSNISKGSTGPLQHYIQTGKWQKEHFEQDSQVREDFEKGKSPEKPRRNTWLREHYTREPFRKMHALTRSHDFRSRKKSSASLRRKQSESSIQTPSEQLSRDRKRS